MKPMIERLLFLILGALIAAGAYIVGNADRAATAQEDRGVFDQVFCRELAIINEDKAVKMLLTTKKGDPILTLFDKSGPRLTLLVKDERSELVMDSKEGEGNRLHLFIEKEGAFLSIARDFLDANKGLHLKVDPQEYTRLLLNGNLVD